MNDGIKSVVSLEELIILYNEYTKEAVTLSPLRKLFLTAYSEPIRECESDKIKEKRLRHDTRLENYFMTEGLRLNMMSGKAIYPIVVILQKVYMNFIKEASGSADCAQKLMMNHKKKLFETKCELLKIFEKEFIDVKVYNAKLYYIIKLIIASIAELKIATCWIDDPVLPSKRRQKELSTLLIEFINILNEDLDNISCWVAAKHNIHETTLFEHLKTILVETGKVAEMLGNEAFEDLLVANIAHEALALEVKKRFYKMDANNEFPILIATILEKLGYSNIYLTKDTNDAGIDLWGTKLISHKDSPGSKPLKEIIGVQCKKYAIGNAVAIRDIKNLHETISRKENRVGYMVTSSTISKNAVRLYAGRLKLLNGDDLVRLILKYRIGITANYQIDENFWNSLSSRKLSYSQNYSIEYNV